MRDAHLKQIAHRLKGLREMSHTSVETMANVLGIAPELYRTYEAGQRDFSVSFLYDCADYLSVDMGEILTGAPPRLQAYTICRAGEGLAVNRRPGLSYLHIASAFRERLAEPCLVTISYSKQDEQSPIPLSRSSGQEFHYVLKGSLRFSVDGQEAVLHEGDAIYFDASKPHGMIAIEGQDCQFLLVGLKGHIGEEQHPAPSRLPDVQPKTTGERIYQQFVQETVDEQGHLTDIAFNIPASFNFAYDVVDALGKQDPNKTALVWESQGGEIRRFSFSDIARDSAKIANYLKRLGIRKGDRVMLILKRHYFFWPTLLALHKLGAIAIPATDQLSTKDLLYRFEKAGVKAVICTAVSDVVSKAETAFLESSDVTIQVLAGGTRLGWLSLEAGIATEAEHYPRPHDSDQDTQKNDPMLMYFTSGTTGYPKIATHDYTYPLGHLVTARWWQNVNPDGLHFTISDSGWAKFMWGKIYGQWLCEAGVFAYDFDRFHADDILKKFQKHHITTFCAPPTMYRMFIKEDLSKYDLSCLEYACTAGEALNPEVYHQFLAHTGLKIMEGFGQTETTLILASLIGTDPTPGCMGKPNPQYHVALLDREGNSVPPGEVGEIVLSTKGELPCGLFQGYYHDTDQTNKAWHNHYYHTGDTAWCDEQGFYWYVARIDDMIKSSGYRIGPFEIESVIMELPYVLECAITGVPDELRGQIVKATVVLTKNTAPSDELKQEIQQYVKQRTAPYKYPRVVAFVDALPKTISGKIRRIEIREHDSAN